MLVSYEYGKNPSSVKHSQMIWDNVQRNVYYTKMVILTQVTYLPSSSLNIPFCRKLTIVSFLCHRFKVNNIGDLINDYIGLVIWFCTISYVIAFNQFIRSVSVRKHSLIGETFPNNLCTAYSVRRRIKNIRKGIMILMISYLFLCKHTWFQVVFSWMTSLPWPCKISNSKFNQIHKIYHVFEIKHVWWKFFFSTSQNTILQHLLYYLYWLLEILRY